MEKRYRKMARKANGKVREIEGETVMLELALPVAEVLQGIPEVIEGLSRDVGLMLMGAVMDSECERIAGRKNSKDPRRQAYWWGSQLGPVYYDEQKALIERPRLRGTDGKEIPLKTYRALRNPKGMKDSVMRKMVLGISSRNYEEAVQSFIKGYGIKKSSLPVGGHGVSRHFVKATAEQVREFMERDLSGLELCAIFIDGIDFKRQMLVAAMGLDKEGRKRVLGLWQGATENRAVCTNLLEDLARRGLDVTKDYLFVLDGSKALRSATAKMFGKDALVQRCQLHKRRNVCDHLPKKHQAAVDARIRAAYKMADYDKAKASLELTIRYLERLNPDAARSLKEGLEETLTVHRLGVGELLRKTLSTTNPIESCFSTARTITGRVKRWRGGDMAQRWAVAALLRAEKKFRRVNGYKEIPKLLLALKTKSLEREEVAA